MTQSSTAEPVGAGMQVFVVAVFVSVFVGIMLEKIDKAVLALAGAIIVILAGAISFHQAEAAIDHNTIGLLLGMMLLVSGLHQLRLFEWLAYHAAMLTGGNPRRIFIVFGVTTAILSAFLDNVTTVLVMLPLIIQMTQAIGADPRPHILGSIFLSNVGGTMTMIGDPPNILIGSQVPGMTFLAFIQYLTLPCIVAGGAVVWFLGSPGRHPTPTIQVPGADLADESAVLGLPLIPASVFRRAGCVIGLVLVGFFTQQITKIEPSVTALAGAVLLLLMFPKRLDLHHGLRQLEWSTLLFFTGLFIIIGALRRVGVLDLLAASLLAVTHDVWGLIMIVLWASAILSAIVDNIPFVAVMIPALQVLMTTPPLDTHPKAYLLWWALSLGACLGGNGTQIGASANVIGCAVARTQGVHISFGEFARAGVPIAFMTIVIAAAYLSVLYAL